MDVRYSDPRPAEVLMKENLIVKHYAGSHAYGTNIATSDVDFRGIFAPDPVNLLTPFFTIREATDTDEEDTKFFELSHFMKLCLDCNPNVIETLWVDESSLVHTSDAYSYLFIHRRDLLSSKAAFTFSGYALSQLKRIKGHNKWINNPQPKEPPRQTDFVSLVQWYGKNKVFNRDFNIRDYYDSYRLVPYGGEVYGLYYAIGYTPFNIETYSLNTLFDGERDELDQPLAVIKWNKEEYRRSKERHEQYWSWKNNRNETRSELEEHFGYDTKHAMHLVRLLRMGVEILRDGEVIVKRPDAAELLEIRDGAWDYDELVKYAEDMDKQVREVWYKKTALRKKPDIKKAAQLLMNAQALIWSDDDTTKGSIR